MSTTSQPSLITERENHIMDWEKARVIGTGENKHQRWISEALELRKQGPRTIDRDEGAFMLSPTCSSILQGANGQRRA